MVGGSGRRGIDQRAGDPCAGHLARPHHLHRGSFGPGSGTDIGARLLRRSSADALGQPVVIENKPGAKAPSPPKYVAKAEPDGYTLLHGHQLDARRQSGALCTKMPYDPIKDFAPITRVAVFTSVIVVNPSLPVKTMQELVGLRQGQRTVARYRQCERRGDERDACAPGG